MNERILELAKQAGMEPDELDENEGIIWWLGNSDLQKFAELIVRECIKISQVGSITESKLKDHFGIEK